MTDINKQKRHALDMFIARMVHGISHPEKIRLETSQYDDTKTIANKTFTIQSYLADMLDIVSSYHTTLDVLMTLYYQHDIIYPEALDQVAPDIVEEMEARTTLADDVEDAFAQYAPQNIYQQEESDLDIELDDALSVLNPKEEEENNTSFSHIFNAIGFDDASVITPLIEDLSLLNNIFYCCYLEEAKVENKRKPGSKNAFLECFLWEQQAIDDLSPLTEDNACYAIMGEEKTSEIKIVPSNLKFH